MLDEWYQRGWRGGFLTGLVVGAVGGVFLATVAIIVCK